MPSLVFNQTLSGNRTKLEVREIFKNQGWTICDEWIFKSLSLWCVHFHLWGTGCNFSPYLFCCVLFFSMKIMSAIKWAATWENRIFAYAKTKTQISFSVTAKLISAFVFATRTEQFLPFLNTKFQASSYLQWLYSSVYVGPGRKPRRPVFWRRGSNSLGWDASFCTSPCHIWGCFVCLCPISRTPDLYEPLREEKGETNDLHMRKQRRRSASR